MTHFSGAGGRPVLGPRRISSIDSSRVPMRFVNQLESGTSSIVLIFCARVFEGVRLATAKRLYERS